MAKKAEKSVIPVDRIASRIYIIRGEKVMLDSDLAELYEVPTKRLNEQVKRNIKRFPEDFMFTLTNQEVNGLRSQFATGSQKHRDPRYPPLAFTEHGVAMLSSVLNSQRAVEVNIGIVRAFIRMREVLATNKELARKVDQHDKEIAVLYDYLDKLMAPPDVPDKDQIGYIPHKEKK